MKKNIIRFFIVLLLSAVIEIVVFQGANILKQYKYGDTANQVYHLDAFEVYNWEEQPDGSWLSLHDPMLFLELENRNVDVLRLQTEVLRNIPYVDIFYINDQFANYGDVYQSCETTSDDSIVIAIGDQVDTLRIDLGDDAGISLNELTVTINPVSVGFSVSRVIAMLVIYWGTFGLSLLQKSPDYGITEKE